MSEESNGTPSQEFVAVLREFLPYLDESTEPDFDVALADYGLDSLGSISLMLELEDAFAITFPDDKLTPESFSTMNSLWRVVNETQMEVEC